MGDTEMEKLIDERRKLAAKLAGVDLQIAMAQGDRELAVKAAEEMNAQVRARYAAKFADQEASR